MQGPTLIANFVATQADVDSNSEVNEALSDYEYYLSLAVPELEKNGVKVHLTNDSTVRWRDDRGAHRLSANGGILYLFVTPKGDTTVLRNGVEIDEAILEAARKRFHLAIPDVRPDSGAR